MSKVEKRVKLLKGMHDYILKEVGDESYYVLWITIVPDEPQDEDFETIANSDDLWVEVVSIFSKFISRNEKPLAQ